MLAHPPGSRRSKALNVFTRPGRRMRLPARGNQDKPQSRNAHDPHFPSANARRLGGRRQPVGARRSRPGARQVQGSAGAGRAGEGRQAAAVDARLPEKPLVVPVVEKVGEYGGAWRRAFLGPADANNYVRVVYDALFRFSPDGAKIEPKIAESAEPSADFKTWTIKLRKGSKWSDGQPFGADDILFWYNDVLLNKELTPTLPGWIKNRRRHAGQGREGRRQHGALHLCRTGDAVPDRGRQPGRRRPHLRDVPAGALPQEVPSRTRAPRPTSRRRRRRRASRPGPSCSPTRTRRRKIPSVRPWRPGRRSAAPAIRCSR